MQTRRWKKSLAALVLLSGLSAFAANQYWDASSTAGYQHGDGNWATNPAAAWWTLNGTVLGAWSDTNTAYFSGTGGRSEVKVDGNAVNASSLFVNGSRYDIVITNGGDLTVSGTFVVGYATTSTNNRFIIVGGVGITSRCSAASGGWVGYNGAGNEVIVDGRGYAGSALFTNNNGYLLGYTTAASVSSSVTVCRGGLFVVRNNTLIVGRSSPYHRMIVSDGGMLDSGSSALYVGSQDGDDNSLLITGSNTVVDKVATLVMGQGAGNDGNRLEVANQAVLTNVSSLLTVGNGCVGALATVTNGGKVFVSGGVAIGLGAGSLACTGLVADAQSQWLAGNFTLGEGTGHVLRISQSGEFIQTGWLRMGGLGSARSNSLEVTAGGRLFSRGSVSVGFAAGTVGNAVRVNGSGSLWDLGAQSLFVGSSATTGNTLTIEVDGLVTNVNLLLAASNNALVVSGGTLLVGRIGCTNDVPLTIGNGIQAAALILTNSGLSGCSPGLRISSNATFQGVALLACGPTGLVVEAGGAFSPGIDGSGAFTNVGNATLLTGSQCRIDLASLTTPGKGWDFLAVTNGQLTLGGTLKPMLADDFLPAAPDRFLIMTNRGPGSVTGPFDNAGNGQAVLAYSGIGAPAGWFTVEIGLQGVVLSGYRAYRAPGVLMMIR